MQLNRLYSLNKHKVKRFKNVRDATHIQLEGEFAFCLAVAHNMFGI